MEGHVDLLRAAAIEMLRYFALDHHLEFLMPETVTDDGRSLRRPYYAMLLLLSERHADAIWYVCPPACHLPARARKMIGLPRGVLC